MNEICKNEECTGCALCANLCDYIHMREDALGFLRPEIDQEHCINCGRCRKYCPALHPHKSLNETNTVLAAWHKNTDILLQSSSGGAFSAFASVVIRHGGVVFGAAFDSEFNLQHIPVFQEKELGRLRGSKYIQSDIGLSYRDAQMFLETGRIVLFSGTPCQIDGLNRFLQKDYDNLYTLDLICHGVPSQGHFKRYLSWLTTKFGKPIKAFQMRAKTFGWGYIVSRIEFEGGGSKILSGLKNAYIYAFLNNLGVQPVCNECFYTTLSRVGDITIADFWKIGLEQPFHHETSKGISLLLVNSVQGEKLLRLSKEELNVEPRTLKEALGGQPRLGKETVSPGMKLKQQAVFEGYLKEGNYEKLAKTFFCDKGVKWLLKSLAPGWLLRKYYPLKEKIVYRMKTLKRKNV